MGILTGIFKSRDKPQNATSGSAYRFFTGGSSSGKNVNERSAMQMTPYLATINNLSSAVVKTTDKTMKITYTLTEESE